MLATTGLLRATRTAGIASQRIITPSFVQRVGLSPSTSISAVTTPGAVIVFQQNSFATAKKTVKKAPAKAKSPAPKKPVAKKEAAKPKPKPKPKAKPDPEKLQAVKEREKEKKEKEREKQKQLKEKEKEKDKKDKEKKKVRKEKEKQRAEQEKLKEKKQKEKEEHDAKPKRALTPYSLFLQEQFGEFKKEYPNEKISSLAQKIAEKWRSLGDKEKEPYLERAQEDRKRYQTEVDAYKKTLPPKRPLTGFMLFSAERRSAIKAANPNASITEIATKIGAEWKKVPDTKKQNYKKTADKNLADWKKKVEEMK